MKFIDLFAGIGGFHLGMEQAGHECVGWVEIDKYARKSYKAIYDTEGEWTKHDITKVTDEEWRQFRGKVDVICGGFPCQSFSIAGKRRGFADETRGTLFFEIARAAKEIQPSYLFLENVKGLLNHDKGRAFRTILATLDECGYDAEWQLCNSKNFGVPQNRERVFIVGHLRGRRTREVFPIVRKGGKADKTIKEVAKINPNRHSGGGQELKVAVCEATKIGYDVAQLGDSINFAQPNSKTRRGRVGHGVANTLTTSVEQATLTGDLRIRKLTPLEAWRLQGFPDWAFARAKQAGLSDSQLYKQAGNSVTVPVIKAIADRMGLEA